MTELSLQARLAKHLLRLITRKVNSLPLEQRRNWPDRAGKLRARRYPDLTIEPVVIGGVDCEWIYRGSPDNRPVIIYYHGGGYVTGSLLSARALASDLAAHLAVRILTVNYRLAPEHPYPAAIEDAQAVYQALIDLPMDPATIAMVGDSAGGGLALATTMAIRDRRLPVPSCLVLLSPWTDLTARSPSFHALADQDVVLKPNEILDYAAYYSNGAPLDDPYLSPVYGRYDGIPPMLIHVGSDELLLDDARRVEAAAKNAGADVTLKIWPGLFHVFSLASNLLPESRESMAEIAAFLKVHLPVAEEPLAAETNEA